MRRGNIAFAVGADRDQICFAKTGVEIQETVAPQWHCGAGVGLVADAPVFAPRSWIV